MLEDEVSVLNLYKGVQMKADRYFDNVLQLKKMAVRNKFNQLHNPPSKDDESVVNVLRATAFVYLTRNEITLTAPMWQFPLFVPEAPLPINYGSIGIVIGHEIAHGYDGKGAEHDEFGNVRSWWDQNTWATFMKKIECFVMQYGKQVEPTIKKNVDGHLTINENIADNGGLRAAYEAYKMRCSREECTALPRMSSFSQEQLFFVAYGNLWCRNVRTSVISQIMENNSHALARFRANVPLQNFPPFAEAFQCPEGSPMNPREKCRVW